MKYSQAGQDEWVLSAIGKKGFFVDVGAYDGVESSNTLLLEENGWSGVCIEASPEFFSSLVVNRPKAENVNMAVMPYIGTAPFSGHKVGSGNAVPCAPIGEILNQCGAPKVIDYMSIDIEGGEIGAIKSMRWDIYKVKLITVEHNLYCEGPANKDEIFRLLSAEGYVRVVDNAQCLESPWTGLPYEDWYAHKAFISQMSGISE